MLTSTELAQNANAQHHVDNRRFIKQMAVL